MNLPITKDQARTACQWLKDCFGPELRAAAPAPFTADHLCGIACQETAYFWLPLVSRLTPAELLARCVLDASGDIAGSSRSAFPKNTAAFIARYGGDFADLLIEEGNTTRTLRGYKPWRKLYKGYGIFQYDLQFVIEDEAFFRRKQWHDLSCVLERVARELRRTHARHQDVKEAIRAYNGAGPAARRYADNVMFYTEIARAI